MTRVGDPAGSLVLSSVPCYHCGERDNHAASCQWNTRVSDPAGELESAHAYAADFGTVLEWCTARTDRLFTGQLVDVHFVEYRTPWSEAELAFRLVRDARQVERRMGGEVA